MSIEPENAITDTIWSATLYYYVNAMDGSTLYIGARDVLTDTDFSLVTWNNHDADEWEEAGAYGDTDVGALGSEITGVLGEYIGIDVTDVISPDGSLVVKLEPRCVPSVTGFCNGNVYLSSVENIADAEAPFMVVYTLNAVAPTSTPTPIPTNT
ncbi:MAG: hypothetical protein KDI03_24150, partial [Anaerolineae bacterium]|nr:hypothetical protein [Anaerolineae bacterium]